MLALPGTGHTVVLGTAGSGKTTLAILRSAYLASPNVDHCGPTLLLTFNNALVAYLNHLKKEANDVALAGVRIETYHKFARGYLNSRGLMRDNCILDQFDKLPIITACLQVAVSKNQNESIFKREPEVFDEEFRWLAQNGIETVEEYQSADRTGRGGTRITRSERPLVFELYKMYLKAREKADYLYDWDDIASMVIKELRKDDSPRLYRHIVIDEGQDFSLQMLKSIVLASQRAGSVTFFGDSAQQIYGNGTPWRQAGLIIRKEWRFEDNYRNSPQIAQLALALSNGPHYAGTEDLVSPRFQAAEGPKPTLMVCQSSSEEIAAISKLAIEAAATRSVAILVRTYEEERAIAAKMPSWSTLVHPKMKVWSGQTGLFHGTIFSAKGLEFDMVFIPFLSAGAWPAQGSIASFGEEEAARKEAKVLYVAITRAKSELVISCVANPGTLLPLGEFLEVVSP